MPLHVLARVQRPVPRRAARAGALHAARGALALRRVRVEVLEVLLLLLGLLPLEALLLVPLPVLRRLSVPGVLLLRGHSCVRAVDMGSELLSEGAGRLEGHARRLGLHGGRRREYLVVRLLLLWLREAGTLSPTGGLGLGLVATAVSLW